MRRRQVASLAGGLLAAPMLVPAARAQAWPSRPIRVVVPFTAGSTADLVARSVLEPVGAELGRPVVVENRGGGGGTVGAALVARSEPDGHTLLSSSVALSAGASLYPGLPYDTRRDFVGVACYGSSPMVVVVAPGGRFASLADLVAAGRARPEAVSFASAGVGSASHMTSERLRIAAGFRPLHVPFRGSPEAFVEVTAGRVDFFSSGLSSTLPLIQDGSVRAVAMSAPGRASSLPQVPTTEEAGYPDSAYNHWLGLFAPARTPAAVVERLHDGVMRALQRPDVQRILLTQALEPMPMTAAAFDGFFGRDILLNGSIIRESGIVMN